MKPRLLSREEEAELARSNKKVKAVHRAEINSGSREDSPSPVFHNTETTFKDKLMGDIPGAFVKAFEFENLMDEDVESDCENEEVANRNRVSCVNVRLSKETKWRIRALIAVWIRLYELPIELYDAELLKEIGESIGKVLRIDSHTAMEARGKYARICIQIDVNKPLVNTICIGSFKQVVYYEGIHSLCFSCGRLGHKIDGYPYTIRKEKDLPIPTEEVQKPGAPDMSRDIHDAQSSASVHAVVDVGEAPEANGHY
ncbi:hypothetical protein SO802_002644 [Lithocarpus litseifolius]|uniref:DUF4283 domain-containing protein n=1 Tax=Lithocarpus litseifolius TaxID=425828 RepID=A0AAW2E1U4_9ROSI